MRVSVFVAGEREERRDSTRLDATRPPPSAINVSTGRSRFFFLLVFTSSPGRLPLLAIDKSWDGRSAAECEPTRNTSGPVRRVLFRVSLLETGLIARERAAVWGDNNEARQGRAGKGLARLANFTSSCPALRHFANCYATRTCRGTGPGARPHSRSLSGAVWRVSNVPRPI